jgi:hypothetical protein
MRFPLVFELIAVLGEGRQSCATMLLKALVAADEQKLSFFEEVDLAIDETRKVRVQDVKSDPKSDMKGYCYDYCYDLNCLL